MPCGSSPLARGTRGFLRRRCLRRRLIPARAGNTRFSRSRITAGSAHPRSRGEHAYPLYRRPHQRGSSPLARGTLRMGFCVIFLARLIPARAGNTPKACTAHYPAAAHPRSRGEHGNRPAMPAIRFGSSPLARGTPSIICRPQKRNRLIPARAGNTPDKYAGKNAQAAHPRSRGEHGSF